MLGRSSFVPSLLRDGTTKKSISIVEHSSCTVQDIFQSQKTLGLLGNDEETGLPKPPSLSGLSVKSLPFSLKTLYFQWLTASWTVQLARYFLSSLSPKMGNCYEMPVYLIVAFLGIRVTACFVCG